MIDYGQIGSHQKVKEDKEYSWPCEPEPRRTIEIDTDDILVRERKGSFRKVSGICCFNIKIPEEDIIEVEEDTRHFYM